MATSTISNTIHGGAGTVVTATLIPASGTPAFTIDDSSEIAQFATTVADGSGHWSLVLERQADITPYTTYWQIQETIPANGIQPPLKRVSQISVGPTDATLLASLVTPSASVLSSYLTQAAADARYASINFIQAGDNAGPRTTLDKLRERVSILDYRVRSDGENDYTSEIKAAVAELGAVGAELIYPPGSYYLGEGLGLKDVSNLTICGAGRGLTKFIVTTDLLTENGWPNTLDKTCGVFTMYRCSGVTFKNFSIIGPEEWHYTGGVGSTGSSERNPAVNSLNYKGIAIRDSCADITLRNVRIRNILDEAVYFDAVDGNPTGLSRDLHFEYLDIQDCGHDGIAPNNPWCENVDIRWCLVKNVGGNCVEGTCFGLTIDSNRFWLPNPSNDFMVALFAFRGRTIVTNNFFEPSDMTLGGGGAMQLGWVSGGAPSHPCEFIVSNNHIASISTNTAATDGSGNTGAVVDIVNMRGPFKFNENIITSCGRVHSSDPVPAAVQIRGADTYMVGIGKNTITRSLYNTHPYEPSIGNQELGIRIMGDVPVDNRICIDPDNLILADTETDFAVAPFRAPA